MSTKPMADALATWSRMNWLQDMKNLVRQYHCEGHSAEWEEQWKQVIKILGYDIYKRGLTAEKVRLMESDMIDLVDEVHGNLYEGLPQFLVALNDPDIKLQFPPTQRCDTLDTTVSGSPSEGSATESTYVPVTSLLLTKNKRKTSRPSGSHIPGDDREFNNPHTRSRWMDKLKHSADVYATSRFEKSLWETALVLIAGDWRIRQVKCASQGKYNFRDQDRVKDSIMDAIVFVHGYDTNGEMKYKSLEEPADAQRNGTLKYRGKNETSIPDRFSVSRETARRNAAIDERATRTVRDRIDRMAISATKSLIRSNSFGTTFSTTSHGTRGKESGTIDRLRCVKGSSVTKGASPRARSRELLVTQLEELSIRSAASSPARSSPDLLSNDQCGASSSFAVSTSSDLQQSSCTHRQPTALIRHCNECKLNTVEVGQNVCENCNMFV